MLNVNCGKDIEVEIDVAKLPANVMDHVIYIGLRNVLMDSHAGVTKDKSTDVYGDSLAIVEKKLAAMYAGDIRVASARTGDPVRSLAIKLAADHLVKASKKKRSEIDAKALREAAIILLGRDSQFMDTARATVEATKGIESDIGDLTAGL